MVKYHKQIEGQSFLSDAMVPPPRPTLQEQKRDIIRRRRERMTPEERNQENQMRMVNRAVKQGDKKVMIIPKKAVMNPPNDVELNALAERKELERLRANAQATMQRYKNDPDNRDRYEKAEKALKRIRRKLKEYPILRGRIKHLVTYGPVTQPEPQVKPKQPVDAQTVVSVPGVPDTVVRTSDLPDVVRTAEPFTVETERAELNQPDMVDQEFTIECMSDEDTSKCISTIIKDGCKFLRVTHKRRILRQDIYTVHFIRSVPRRRHSYYDIARAV